MTGLDSEQRAALERLIVRARSGLEQDLEAQAEGRYGINSDGTIEDEAALHLDPSALADRREIVAIVEHLRSEGESATGAVARLIREAAFTHLNRLVAIRVAEAMRLLPPSLADGRASQGFRDVLEVAPLVAGDETGGYWAYLRLCGDEMASDAPMLFDPRNPLLTLSPSVAALDEVVALLSDRAVEEIWTASDTFGWAYQFFNTGDERRQMREESGAPRDSRELAVRNQFFTPRYVVDFLVQNTLGRRLLEAQIDPALIDALPLLVDPPSEQGEPLRLDNVRILDPACGSGHFLLGCYDLLERAWQLEGVKPAEAAPLIVPTLWGIDIDPRCAQVASAAIVFRARRHCRELPLPRPNVITARALPDGSSSWEQLLASLPSDRRDLVQSMREALAHAHVLGPLLKAEELLAAEIRRHFTGSDAAEGTFAEGIAPDAFGEVESEVLEALQRVADSASSSAAQRLLAAEAGDAIRFVEAMRQRYEVVLMNPPFGEPVSETKPYLKSKYPLIPQTAYLEAAFIQRGQELVSADGYVGAITSRAGMFLTGFEKWRSALLADGRFVALADLGQGVMEQALVEAAAYVLRGQKVDPGTTATFIRLMREPDRQRALFDAVTASRNGTNDARVWQLDQSSFSKVPGSPLAYWSVAWIRDLFSSLPPLEGAGAEVRVGSWPGDDFRHLRLWWEIAAKPDRPKNKEWIPYAKGGGYSPFYAEPHLVVDWDRERGTFWEFYGRKGRPTHIPENVEYYFRPGLTWSRRTASSFGVRVLPRGCIFADKGPAAFAIGDRNFLLLAWLSSLIARACLDTMVAAGERVTSGGVSRSYEVGLIQKLPWPGDLLSDEAQGNVSDLILRVVRDVRSADVIDEVTRSFTVPAGLLYGGTLAERTLAKCNADDEQALRILSATSEIEGHWLGALPRDDQAEAYLRNEVGPHPCSYIEQSEVNSSAVEELYSLPMDQLVNTVIEAKGAKRYLASISHFTNRRIELISHALEIPPKQVAEQRRRLGVLPPDALRRTVDDLSSYLVGVALGRWDVRLGLNPELATLPEDPMGPLPPSPPGTLGPIDQSETEPSDYPIRIPPGRLLLDEPGHAWDVERAIVQAATALFDDPEAILGELLRVLGRKSVREYLRRQFFRDHTARYSKSRRKAPVYWFLSVPSREWGLWVYAPKLSRETLFAVAGEAARREALAAEAIRRLQAERDAGGSGRSVREVAEALTGEEALAEELRTFRAEADRIAGLGWEPDLDDGIILCAAPLATLFPVWPDAGKERDQIRKGEYSWATVSRWKDAL